MTDSPRVLVVTYLPPTPGGIATWAGILGDRREGGIRAEFLGVPSATGSSLRGRLPIAANLRFLWRLGRRLALDPPDLVHLNCCLSPRGVWRDLAVAIAARAAGTPIVVQYHGSLPDVVPRLPTPSRAALRRLMRLASLNIGVTAVSKQLLNRFCPATEAAFVPNFIEEAWTLRSRSAANVSHPRRIRSIYVGRLSRDKGTPELLRSIAALPDVDFELVGPVVDEVTDLLEGAPTNAVATGPLPRERVLEKLLTSDLFVFPSRREGFPYALLEAMAVGLPVVASRVGAVSDMIGEGQGGFLVEPGDATALTKSIERLAADRGTRLRMGAHNRAVCAARFTAPVVEDLLAGLYRRVTSSPAPRRRARLDSADAAKQRVC